MASLQIVQQANARISSLPKGLVALFVGATSGINQAALQLFAQQATAPRIFTVARPSAVESHQKFLNSLQDSNPLATFNLIEADVSLISETDKVIAAVTEKETKLDLLFVSPGFLPLDGRFDTKEGLEPSMTIRYYSRLRILHHLIPLLNKATIPSPRILWILAGGKEGPLNEDDLDVREPSSWSWWNASVHTATMSTLTLERIAKENPNFSIVHWYPGPVNTPILARATQLGLKTSDASSVEEAGARALFMATNDRYAVRDGLVPIPEGFERLKRTFGGIFLADPKGEVSGDEKLLSDLRERGVDKKVWDFSFDVFAKVFADQRGNGKEEYKI